jgi:curved DNA-binding protein
MSTDYYATLGVSKTATADEIKKAFRKLASQHHPDKGGDTQKFQEIQAAYDVLGDQTKRQAYDHPQPQFGGFQFQQGQNIHDIFSQMFGGASPFGQRRAPNHVRMSLWIRLEDVARGGKKTVAVNTSTGSNTVDLEIPLGIDDGDNVSYNGVAPGGLDLVIQYRIHPNPRFQRNGMNLYTDVTVSVWDLLIGGEVVVTDILGTQMTMRIPAGTQPGTNMRIRTHGLRDRQGQQGDLMVKINAEVPRTISPELVAAIQQYRK